jgi:hypothetical protein
MKKRKVHNNWILSALPLANLQLASFRIVHDEASKTEYARGSRNFSNFEVLFRAEIVLLVINRNDYNFNTVKFGGRTSVLRGQQD